ncbi:protein-glutamate O-methyltransferase family protein [Nitrosomonas sp. HPC101]|uniref:damage-control phosphatase ARMT1 family protein n=1 Tax=Nitrosomonas sp. HPC101 TaxID=1658667 RepID=UPI00136F35C7|nr:damage-control phosphatase ARMT1 family protein [Nitrosomonas sp. HPC101]MXS84774.1 protein-glutamate O-methyltransferase family protein [Nitrosomonas sp. HPC101]
MPSRPPPLIPPHLTTAEPNSFAAFSLEKRLPVILGKLIDNADTPAAHALQQLATEMQKGTITSLPPTIFGTLDQVIEPYSGRRWENMPFLTVELYFYARILLACGYTAATPVDPFQSAKEMANKQAIASLATRADYCDPDCAIGTLLGGSVIGNTADLSQHTIPAANQVSLLVDERDAAERLLTSGMHRIDFIFDNAGTDVLADLLLIRRISSYCPNIVAHVRPWPMFISDMILTDMERLIDNLKTSSVPMVHQLGEDIAELLRNGQLIIQASSLLGLPISFCEDSLAQEMFQDSALVILKGDLNYRLFAGDRRWPHTAEKDYFLQRFGRSALFLRTLKSEVLAGLSAETFAQTRRLEPDWLTSGRHGIIQVFATNVYVAQNTSIKSH